jgi:hypothetical protein
MCVDYTTIGKQGVEITPTNWLATTILLGTYKHSIFVEEINNLLGEVTPRAYNSSVNTYGRMMVEVDVSS